MNADTTKPRACTRVPWSSRFAGLVPLGGTGMPASNEGPVEVIIMGIIGGFIGLLIGFILSQLARFVSMFAGISMGAPGWGAYGAIAGALAFVVFALVGD